MWRVLFWLSAAALAVPALTLTVARALDTDNGSMIRIESFTPLALPLYAVLVVLLGVGAWRQRDARKPPMVGGRAGRGRAGSARMVVRAAGGRSQPGTRRRERSGSR